MGRRGGWFVVLGGAAMGARCGRNCASVITTPGGTNHRRPQRPRHAAAFISTPQRAHRPCATGRAQQRRRRRECVEREREGVGEPPLGRGRAELRLDVELAVVDPRIVVAHNVLRRLEVVAHVADRARRARVHLAERALLLALAVEAARRHLGGVRAFDLQRYSTFKMRYKGGNSKRLV